MAFVAYIRLLIFVEQWLEAVIARKSHRLPDSWLADAIHVLVLVSDWCVLGTNRTFWEVIGVYELGLGRIIIEQFCFWPILIGVVGDRLLASLAYLWRWLLPNRLFACFACLWLLHYILIARLGEEHQPYLVRLECIGSFVDYLIDFRRLKHFDFIYDINCFSNTYW